MLLRRRMSRFSRTTEKFVATAPAETLSSVWMFSAPIPNLPTVPVSRPPATTGTDCP